jgi:hypothetical protein
MYHAGSIDENTGNWIGDVQVEEAKKICYNTPVMDMLLCVNDIMFNKLKFTGATEDIYYTPQVSCIDKVSNAQYSMSMHTIFGFMHTQVNIKMLEQCMLTRMCIPLL